MQPCTITRDSKGALWHRSKKQVTKVCEVREAAQILGRSIRHVYRLAHSGELRVVDKILGSVLLDAASIKRFKLSEPQKQPLPQSLQCLFPEYEIKVLNAGRDRNLVVGRVLELGKWEDVRWLFRRYQEAEIRAVVVEEGLRTLGPRSRALWMKFFDLDSKDVRSPRYRSIKNPWSFREV
jgi:hypothetical protein